MDTVVTVLGIATSLYFLVSYYFQELAKLENNVFAVVILYYSKEFCFKKFTSS